MNAPYSTSLLYTLAEIKNSIFDQHFPFSAAVLDSLEQQMSYYAFGDAPMPNDWLNLDRPLFFFRELVWPGPSQQRLLAVVGCETPEDIEADVQSANLQSVVLKGMPLIAFFYVEENGSLTPIEKEQYSRVYSVFITNGGDKPVSELKTEVMYGDAAFKKLIAESVFSGNRRNLMPSGMLSAMYDTEAEGRGKDILARFSINASGDLTNMTLTFLQRDCTVLKTIELCIVVEEGSGWVVPNFAMACSNADFVFSNFRLVIPATRISTEEFKHLLRLSFEGIDISDHRRVSGEGPQHLLYKFYETEEALAMLHSFDIRNSGVVETVSRGLHDSDPKGLTIFVPLNANILIVGRISEEAAVHARENGEHFLQMIRETKVADIVEGLVMYFVLRGETEFKHGEHTLFDFKMRSVLSKAEGAATVKRGYYVDLNDHLLQTGYHATPQVQYQYRPIQINLIHPNLDELMDHLARTLQLVWPEVMQGAEMEAFFTMVKVGVPSLKGVISHELTVQGNVGTGLVGSLRMLDVRGAGFMELRFQAGSANAVMGGGYQPAYGGQVPIGLRYGETGELPPFFMNPRGPW